MEAAIHLEPDVEEREGLPAPLSHPSYLSTAEVAPCTCPEWCERDHDRD
jgi:hypothetical protein